MHASNASYVMHVRGIALLIGSAKKQAKLNLIVF